MKKEDKEYLMSYISNEITELKSLLLLKESKLPAYSPAVFQLYERAERVELINLIYSLRITIKRLENITQVLKNEK